MASIISFCQVSTLIPDRCEQILTSCYAETVEAHAHDKISLLKTIIIILRKSSKSVEILRLLLVLLISTRTKHQFSLRFLFQPLQKSLPSSCMSSPNKQCYSDQLPTWLLKDSIETLSPFLEILLSISLTSGEFPVSWKHPIAFLYLAVWPGPISGRQLQSSPQLLLPLKVIG